MALYTCHCCGKREEGVESWLCGETYPRGWHLHVIQSPQVSEYRGTTLSLIGCCIQCHEALVRAAGAATQRYVFSEDLSFMDWIKQLAKEVIKNQELEKREEEAGKNKKSKICIDKSEDM